MIVDRFRTVKWKSYSYPTGVVKRVLKAPTFPLTAKQDINSEDEVTLIRQTLLRQIHPMIERELLCQIRKIFSSKVCSLLSSTINISIRLLRLLNQPFTSARVKGVNLQRSLINLQHEMLIIPSMHFVIDLVFVQSIDQSIHCIQNLMTSLFIAQAASYSISSLISTFIEISGWPTGNTRAIKI